MSENNSSVKRVKKVLQPKWDEDVARLVLYADFLGFKARVNSTSHTELKNLLLSFNEAFHKRMQPLQMGGYLRFVQFSDSILIVVNGTNSKMFNLITKAAVCVMQEALRINFGIKGVIAQGVFSFDESNGLFFGRPLVDAYELHEELKYYGIVVHHSAENTVKNNISAGTPYSKNEIYIERGKVAHYHLCWNLLDTLNATKDITSLCNSWLDTIEETVSGHPRQYIDRTREVLLVDSKEYKKNIINDLDEEGKKS